ncbi:MAG TPA: aldo/keto reductase [Candidatus Sulfotelmatobacter sp.]|nr:aldo/keto reductase [Candidatus Sulfotelmatobacter sp.]
MELRKLGRTGLPISVLGYGCGAVGGLMVRGAPAEQERAVARAVDAGITYFDTAQLYGNGESERNLGRVLGVLKPKVYVGTKVNLPPTERGKIGAAVIAAMDASLQRLNRESVDLFQLHNTISTGKGDRMLAPEVVLEEVIPAFELLKLHGKTRFCGFTAVGETPALHKLVDSRAFDTAQVSFNLLNPSAGGAVPANYPAQDYGQLLARAHAANMGTIGIRVLAGGALSASAERHPNASPPPDPIGSASTYNADLERAKRLAPLVSEGHASSLVEASLRFVIANPALTTVLIGIATVEQLETAIAAVERGPLPAAALARVGALQAAFAGEAR